MEYGNLNTNRSNLTNGDLYNPRHNGFHSHHVAENNYERRISQNYANYFPYPPYYPNYPSQYNVDPMERGLGNFSGPPLIINNNMISPKHIEVENQNLSENNIDTYQESKGNKNMRNDMRDKTKNIDINDKENMKTFKNQEVQYSYKKLDIIDQERNSNLKEIYHKNGLVVNDFSSKNYEKISINENKKPQTENSEKNELNINPNFMITFSRDNYQSNLKSNSNNDLKEATESFKDQNESKFSIYENKETFIERSFELPNNFYSKNISPKKEIDQPEISYKKKPQIEIEIPSVEFNAKPSKPTENIQPKSIKLEIPLDPYTNDHNGKSLAELFQEKKAKLAKKLENDKSKNSKNKKKRRELTKEDLAECKKEAMNYGKIERKGGMEPDRDLIKLENMNNDQDSKRGPPPKILERLSQGIKPKIDRKEMYALTKKNYENLPEIKKRKEEEEVKAQLKDRLRDQKERMKKFDEERRKRLNSKRTN